MWTRVTVLYDGGRMADALQVVDAIGRRFPKRGAYMSSPRACLHAVMGDIDEAIRVIRDGAAALDAIEPAIIHPRTRRSAAAAMDGEDNVLVRRARRRSTPSSSVGDSSAGLETVRRSDTGIRTTSRRG